MDRREQDEPHDSDELDLERTLGEVAAEIDAAIAEELGARGVRWRALELARELALLGARSMIASDPDAVVDAHRGFSVFEDEWRRLGDRMIDLLDAEDRWLDGPDLALRDRLLDALGLQDAEFWLTMLAAAAELHPEVAAALSIVAEDERVAVPTPSSAARLLAVALERPYTEVLAAGLGGAAPLRLGLLEAVEVVAGRPRTHQGLRLAAGELAGLLGAAGELGRGEAGELEVELQRCGATPVHRQRLVAGAARLLDARGLLCIRSDSPRAARQLALDVACVVERELGFVVVGDALPSHAGLERLAAEALPALDLRAWPTHRPLPIAALERLAAVSDELLILVGARTDCGRLTSIEVPELGPGESRRVWSQVCADELAAAALARRFRVSLDEARGAATEARDRLVLDGQARDPEPEEIAVALRARGARRMGGMVTVLPGVANLDRLVVPAGLRRQLDDIVGWQRASVDVAREYFREHDGRSLGRGLTCLFSGLPGTGKTFAAQCLATELGLNLYRIDLSQVVSKWLGETEKALARVFDEAEAGHGLLLFDEADALFGKRTEVKDAHDRYANVEVGYLLQRMESFAGVAILTTNLRSNIDAAFVRRLRFVIEFPMPDAQRRAQLWDQALPSADKRAADLELEPFIERFRLSGGHIHNIGLAATHLAAAARQPLATEQLVRATYRELEKSGLARSPADFGPLARWLDHDHAPSKRARGVAS